MPQMVSTIDIVLQIPPKMRGIFPNVTALNIELKAGVPKDVPQYVLDYYTSNRPKVYKRYSETQKMIDNKEEVSKKEEKPKTFNPEDWLNGHYDLIEESVQTLDRKQLMAVGKYMRLSGYHKQTSDRVMERIIADVKMKIKQSDELNKFKEAQ